MKIVMDVNLLPSEYKTENVMEGLRRYEQDFNVIIVPIDASKMNTAGSADAHILKIFP